MKPNTYDEFVDELLAALGPEWSVERQHDSYSLSILTGPEHCRVSVRPDHHEWAQAERVTFHGGWPSAESPGGGSRQFYPYHENYEISAALQRGPAALARDLERRLMPTYLPAWRKQVQDRDDFVHREQLKAQAINEIAELLQTQPAHNSECTAYLPAHLGYGSVKVEHYSGRLHASLKLDQIPYDTALALLRLLTSPPSDGIIHPQGEFA
jgi:hypothetical protein